MDTETPSRHMIQTKTLSIEELRETAKERVELIAKEFSDGFAFLEKYPKSVTIFGGSRFREHDMYYQKARTLAGKIAREGFAVFTGGGPGIMEAGNRGAKEAGGASIGLTIDLSPPQVRNTYLTDSIDFYYFFARKVCMAFSAEAYIFFPGGFGTLNEFFEIVTLVQTGKIEKMPIILFGADFWNALDGYMKKELLSRDTIIAEDLTLYTITDDMNQVIDIIKNAPVRNGQTFWP